MSRVVEAAAAAWKDRRRLLLSWFALPLSLVAALLLGAIMMLVLGANPVTGYHALVAGAFEGSYDLGCHRREGRPAPSRRASGSASRSAPTSSTSAARARLAMGGSPSAATALALPEPAEHRAHPARAPRRRGRRRRLGGDPGAFKAYFNVNEILSTIMLNLVAVQIMNCLLAGPMVDHTQNSTYGLIPADQAPLRRAPGCPILVPGTQLHLGVLIAVVVAVGV